MSESVFDDLVKILEDRRTADPGKSYVAKLYSGGDDAILKKVGEEATEVILAAKNNDRQNLVYETADLWFHTLILLTHHEIAPADVLAELQRRFGVSGLAEKAARKNF